MILTGRLVAVFQNCYGPKTREWMKVSISSGLSRAGDFGHLHI